MSNIIAKLICKLIGHRWKFEDTVYENYDTMLCVKVSRRYQRDACQRCDKTVFYDILQKYNNKEWFRIPNVEELRYESS